MLPAVASMIVPPVIYGVGIFRLWADLGVLDTFGGVLVVHVVLGLPFVIVTVGATLATIDRRLGQAARRRGRCAQTSRQVAQGGGAQGLQRQLVPGRSGRFHRVAAARSSSSL